MGYERGINLGDQRVRGVCEEETGVNGRVKLRGVKVCKEGTRKQRRQVTQDGWMMEERMSFAFHC